MARPLLIYAPSPSNPSRPTAPYQSPPSQGVSPLPKPSVSALASPISRHRQSASHLVYPASRTSPSCWHPLLRSASWAFLPTHTTSLSFVVECAARRCQTTPFRFGELTDGSVSLRRRSGRLRSSPSSGAPSHQCLILGRFFH